MATSSEIIAKTVQLGANNYHSREVVIEHALGAKVYDPEGRAYYDMLSAYSALNFGHLHPEIVAAAMEQLQKVTLTSRAFHNAVLGDFYEQLCDLTGKAMILPMNTGAEAVETALKTARRWGVEVKGVANEQQEIIVCANNFHGRTIAIIRILFRVQISRTWRRYPSGGTMIPASPWMGSTRKPTVRSVTACSNAAASP